MTFFGLIGEDWRRIPQNVRYYILTGVTLLSITWVADHWGNNTKYNFFGWHFRQIFFELGVLLILLGLFMLLSKQMYLSYRLSQLRRKYALKKLNKTYYLVWFRGRLILFDKLDKHSYHVHPLGTARDLSLNVHGVIVDQDFDEARTKKTVIGKRGEAVYVKVSEYKYFGQINTRR